MNWINDANYDKGTWILHKISRPGIAIALGYPA